MLGRPTLWLLAALMPLMAACTDITSDPKTVVAVSLDYVASPSVVAGDTMRDTNGVVQRLRGTAYNFRGQAIAGYPIIYRAIDLGLHIVDSGFVVADTASLLPVRILADAGGLQTQPVQLFIVPPPYQVIKVDTTDSVVYSLHDTTSILSSPLTVRVLPQDTVTTTIPIQGYLVSYAIQQATDTVWAQLVNGTGQPQHVDTTGSAGTAGQSVRIRPLQLPMVTDSVIVLATVKYRGAPLPGSPVKFVLRVKPPDT
jgi:hypothetical protein